MFTKGCAEWKEVWKNMTESAKIGFLLPCVVVINLLTAKKRPQILCKINLESSLENILNFFPSLAMTNRFVSIEVPADHHTPLSQTGLLLFSTTYITISTIIRYGNVQCTTIYLTCCSTIPNITSTGVIQKVKNGWASRPVQTPKNYDLICIW